MKKSTKVVVVDDNTDYLFTMETFLTRNGCEVYTSNDGQKGFALIKTEKPDIILLDVMMETLFSGLEIQLVLLPGHCIVIRWQISFNSPALHCLNIYFEIRMLFNASVLSFFIKIVTIW